MGGTRAGAAKKLSYMVEQFGSVELAKEARRKQMQELGSIGGKNGKTEGFAHGRVSPSEAGKKSAEVKKQSWLKTEVERLKAPE